MQLYAGPDGMLSGISVVRSGYLL